MNIYNSLTRKIELFKPFNEKEITMYTCGPTVYHYAHIGNLRTYIFEDILEKTLKHLNYNVKRVMNITDVGHMANDSDDGEDKMLKGAKREHKTVYEIADYYTKAFFNDIEKLNIKKPSIIEKASDHVQYYIEIIIKLLNKDHAYIAENGNIYFDVSKIDNYYQLSGKNSEELIVGARETVGEDEYKRNPSDFGLWFVASKFENQAMQWDSPWGRGYPGWHIECTGISIKYLGEHLDIHCGGVDNIFPHHTNEIAQSESFLGHSWCKYWMHGEHLNDSTGKMSKSNGEFLTLSLLEQKGYTPLEYRFFCLQSHYRKQLVFTYEGMENAKIAYSKLKNKVNIIKENLEGEIDIEIIKKYQNQFEEALKNDLNTSQALTTLYDILKDDINNNTKLKLIEEIDEVLSLDLLKEETKTIDNDLLKYINNKLEERKTAKENKDYALADTIRAELEQKNIFIKDTKEGTTFEIK